MISPDSTNRGEILQRLVVDPGQVVDGRIELTAAQQHYLYRVLRLRSGQRFIALDGTGGQWL
ncbi:RNA methyltransferase PUA domain-containing protein, partial [Haemophilus parainfluenzae]|uniref:RNA methyltransferase PUA domain-containing protein n=1 Tax=Haemophilus parainfluenzae TaxID=729 RepID=UPI00157E5B71